MYSNVTVYIVAYMKQNNLKCFKKVLKNHSILLTASSKTDQYLQIVCGSY